MFEEYKKEFSDEETFIIAQLWDSIIDKFLKIKQLEWIKSLSKVAMTDQERLYLIAKQSAFNEFVDFIKWFTKKVEVDDAEKIRKAQAKTIRV